MRDLSTMLGIKISALTAYHPQTDGQMERINQEVEHFLQMFCNYRQDDWAEWLSLAEFAYNNHISASSQHTPFMVETGRNPRMGFELVQETRIEEVSDFVDRMKTVQEEATATLVKAAEDMKRFYDAHRQPAPEYQPGDKVWLDVKDVKTTRPTKKLDDK